MSLFSPTECLGDGVVSMQCTPLSSYGRMDVTSPSFKFTYVFPFMEYRFPTPFTL